MNIEDLTEEERAALRKRFDDLVLAVEATPEPPLPLACVLKVVETFVNVAYGGGKSDVVVLVDGHDAKHHVSAPSGQFHEDELVVLLGANACAKVSPVFEKWRGRTARKLTFDLGGGMGTFDAITFRVDKSFYPHNPGQLIPASEFPELADCEVGDNVGRLIGVMTHNDLVHVELGKARAPRKGGFDKSRLDALKKRYLKALKWRAYRAEEIGGDAPDFITCCKLEKLDAHPEYFTEYADLLFDVTEKYNGLNLSIYYDAEGDGKVHLYHKGKELMPSEDSFFWHAIRQQGVDRALADMGYAFVLQGVLTGPSVKGGAFEGRTIDRFWVFDIYDNEEKQTLSPSDRIAFCREAGIPRVSLVARQFPLFEKAPTLEPLLKTATLPNKVGAVRHGLVFRSFREGREIWFELENPEYEPCPDQLMLDEKFREDLKATSWDA